MSNWSQKISVSRMISVMTESACQDSWHDVIYGDKSGEFSIQRFSECSEIFVDIP